MARLFLGVWPPEEVVAHLTSLRRKDQRGVRFVRPENWHITLRFLGETDPDTVIAAVDQASLMSARAHLGPAVDVLSERALVLPVTGLDDLAEAVTRTTAHLGQAPRKRFTGHLTLARVKPNVFMPTTLGTLIDADFAVEEIALVQSRLDHHGARYETLHTWSIPSPLPHQRAGERPEPE